MGDYEVITAFLSLVGKHLPLRQGKDVVYVSPEAVRFVPMDARLATSVDLRLRGTEMRLVRPCR